YELTGATVGTGASLNGILINVGSTKVTWTITDASGNSNTCEYDIVIEDDQLPFINCPANITLNTDAGVCNRLVQANLISPTSFGDNCPSGELILNWSISGATTNNGTGPMPAFTMELGLNTINYTVTDLYGNSAECSFTVTIRDVIPP